MKEDINDNEIRLIGSTTYSQGKRKWLIAVAVVVALLVAIVIVMLAFYRTSDTEIGGIYEPQPTVKSATHPLREWLYLQDSVAISGCAIKDTVVNDISVRIYLPLNARPALAISMHPLDDKQVILAFQAADIRADNKKIVGAFVEKGKPVAWGLSKKGYCAILHDSIYVGMAENSPLFEQATDCGGYFFRQYPLVSNGIAQESELKTQSLRRALCEVEEHICVIESQDRASMHDFAVLLADLEVNNAIYLIGGDAMAVFADVNGIRTKLGNFVDKPFKYTNFIYWTKS